MYLRFFAKKLMYIHSYTEIPILNQAINAPGLISLAWEGKPASGSEMALLFYTQATYPPPRKARGKKVGAKL